MRWSQLKQRVEANFAPRVRGRIELFQTRYRRAADSFGEVWVVIDGKRRYSWGDITFIQAEAAAYQPDRASMKGENPSREECCAANRRVLGNSGHARIPPHRGGVGADLTIGRKAARRRAPAACCDETL